MNAVEVVAENKVIADKLGKVYCSYGHVGESNWIQPLGFDLTQNIEEADVVVFGGGKDVDPGLYNEKIGKRTCLPNARDKQEKEDFEFIQKVRKEGKNILSVGVCRGHQLLCVLSGGKLIQDVGNHAGSDHLMSTFDKQAFKTNSIHHQMIYPYKMDKKHYKILGWSTKNISSRYLNGWEKETWLPEGFKEIESAYYPETHAIGFQGHPEMIYRRGAENQFVQWCQEQFLKAFKKQL